MTKWYNLKMTQPFEMKPDNVNYFTKLRAKKRLVDPRECRECGVVFTPAHHNEVCCSDTCKNIRYSRRTSHPSKNSGSFLNLNSFEKAWKEAKKQHIWHEENIRANQIKEPFYIDKQ